MGNVFKETGLRWLWLALLLLIIDQVTKHWVAATFNYREVIEVMPFFNLTYVHNPGAAFSWLADQSGWQRWFLSAVAIVVSVMLIIWMRKTPKQQALISIAFALILSGAIGNVIDRLMFGYVIDFLDFYIGNKHWPAFNVADSAIFVGAALMIYDAFTNNEQSDNRTGENKQVADNEHVDSKQG
ncbi:signal peptidase II [Thalassotalea maritima]|uniref:signal peptidase II n=1 Tax=Thalassotalea maritima TaxID=3242416 RepID=UPI0035283E27